MYLTYPTAKHIQNPNSLWLFQVQEDHNYGEPGPSTLRHSRRIEQLTQVHRTHESSATNHSDSPVDPLRIPDINSQRSLRTRTQRNNLSNVDIDSDPDDDKPLHSLVTESPNRGNSRPSRQNTRYSDEHISHSQQTASSSVATPSSSMRPCRTQKRPLYLEASDEEDGHRAKRSATHSRYVFFFLI